jgi:hypothetical protein
MTTSERAAESLLGAYLNERTMPKILHDAFVWVVASRLASGETPVLDETLRSDIGHQAIAPPGRTAVPFERPVVYALLQRSDRIEAIRFD